MSKLTNRLWWLEVFERALKSAAQFAIAGIGGAMFIDEVQWWAIFSTAALGFILSNLTSIATLPEKEAHFATDKQKVDSNKL